MLKTQTTPNLVEQWNDSNSNEGFEAVYQVISQDWKSPGALYEEYCEIVEDPVSKGTFSQYLKELEALGEAESKGFSHSRRYRQADKPVNHVVQSNPNTKLSRMSRKIRKIAKLEVEKSIQSGELSHLIEKKALEKLDEMLADGSLEAEIKKTREPEPLDYHKERILNSVKELESWNSSTEIFNIYQEKVEEAYSKRNLRRHLKDLSEQGLIQKKGSTRNVRYKA